MNVCVKKKKPSKPQLSTQNNKDFECGLFLLPWQQQQHRNKNSDSVKFYICDDDDGDNDDDDDNFFVAIVCYIRKPRGGVSFYQRCGGGSA